MEKTNLLPSIIVNPKKDPIASVIWLHGLGADGHDFENIVPELSLPETLPVRFIFPHAPLRPITLNGGYVMRAWYDIHSLALDQDQDEIGIRTSKQAICALIEQEQQQGILSNRIILAGFSQGGVMALYTGLRYSKPLGGVLALSSYLALDNTLDAEAHAASKDIPIMMAHGTMDPLIPLSLAESSKHLLEKKGYKIEWHTYPMEHTVCSNEILDISEWLKKLYTSKLFENA